MKVVLNIALFFVIFGGLSCTKTIHESSENPFDDITNDTTATDSVNPATIQGLHKNIFSVRCANPTCHDGTFEPDFRTIESTYNSLVYHPVIKNDSLLFFKFRVVPYNTGTSWLIERLLTEDPVLGRMPIYSTPLDQKDMDNIQAWINNGARDVTGKVAKYPNTNAEVKYFLAYDTSGVRIDTNRVSGWSTPFVAEATEPFYLHVKVVDDSTNSSDLLINEFKFSTLQNDFSNAITIQATYYNYDRWRALIPVGTFTTNQQIYYRFNTRDPDHTDLTEYPRVEMPYYYKENASFILL